MRDFTKLLCGAALPLLFTGCIDDKYDLSDIDTTSEFKVKDLVLPVNLEPIVLSDVIKIKEGDELKEVTINGNTFYAVEQTGDFHSDGIDVNTFYAEPEPMTDKTAIFKLAESRQINGKRNANTSKSYLLEKEVNEALEYEAKDIDGAVRDLSSIYFKDMSLKMTVSTTNLSSGINSQMSNVKLTIPKGLTLKSIKAGNENYDTNTYNATTGELSLTKSFALSNNRVVIEIIATAVDLSSYDKPFKYNKETNSGSMDLKSVFNLTDAQLQLSGETSELAAISEVEYNVHYELAELEVTSIMGRMEYDLSGTGLAINPIDLTNMPSFLANPETDLKLTNPQIYLQLKNPIGKYGLGYQSSLDIISIRENNEERFTSPLIEVPATDGDYNFVLAPYPDKIVNVPEDYTNPDRLTYKGLGDILSGNGLPKQLDIKLIDPMIPEQTLTSPFELGKSIEGMEGNYMFLAPLSLAEGSTIVKAIDGWWSEDLSDLNIDYLTIIADATNELSTGVIINIFAIDREGNQISTTGSLKLDENAMNAPIEIKLAGIDGKPFNNLDGVKLYVIAGENDGEPLAPNQVITLSNLKAKVTGNYTRKL